MSISIYISIEINHLFQLHFLVTCISILFSRLIQSIKASKLSHFLGDILEAKAEFTDGDSSTSCGMETLLIVAAQSELPFLK